MRSKSHATTTACATSAHCIRDAMKKMLEYVPSLDYAKLTREYTQRLEAKRMGVKANVFQSLLKKRQ